MAAVDLIRTTLQKLAIYLSITCQQEMATAGLIKTALRSYSKNKRKEQH